MPEPQGGIENEVAGVGGHKYAALYDLGYGLNDEEFRFNKASLGRIRPQVRERLNAKVTEEANILYLIG